MDYLRILSLVKKNSFTSSSQVKNTLEEVGVSESTEEINVGVLEQAGLKLELEFSLSSLSPQKCLWRSLLHIIMPSINAFL